MEGQFRAPLQDQRFHLSEESIEQMRVMRGILQEIQKDFPEVKAMSFFGSRIIGRENKDSDLDAVLFLDDREFIQRRENEIGSNVSIEELTHWNNDIEEKIKEMISVGWSKYYYNKNKPEADYHVHPAPISNEAVQDLFDVFKNSYLEELDAGMPGWMLYLVTPFCLGVGDIVSVRQKILALIEQDKNADELYQKFLAFLQKLERTKESPKHPANSAPPYRHFPQNIQDAKIYFLKEK